MYQVKVFNPVTGSFKFVGPISASAKALEIVNKKACIQCWKTGLMVTTVGV